MNINFLNNLYVVIVIYNQEITSCVTLNSLYLSLKSNVDFSALDVLIYDNSAKAQNISGVKLNSHIKLSYLHDSKNSGVSKAYNTAAKIASKLGKEWLLIFDHDTKLPSESIKCYSDAMNNNREYQIFSPILLHGDKIISPCKYKGFRGYVHTQQLTGACKFSDFVPINSGLLINLNLFHNVGGYNEDLKLDFSDFYFIKKIKNFIDTFFVIDLRIQHDLSGFNLNDINNTTIRFISYCESAVILSKTIKDFIALFIIVLLRSLVLSYRMKSISFFFIFLQHFVFRKINLFTNYNSN